MSAGFPCASSLRRFAPRVGLEPTTTRLTAECSTIELSRISESALHPQNRTLNYLIFSNKPLSFLVKLSSD